MKNVTIKLEDDVANWSRVWAAEHNTSVSRILGELLKRMKKEKTGYAKAMQQFLSVEPRPLKTSGAYPSRDDLHAR
ncbi:MAG TPA: CopG family transcriptional regulator [Gammaproteobacteria bacterium]|nr:CopG family transcriptional regulator [Gammaproteobacteria bacterium]